MPNMDGGQGNTVQQTFIANGATIPHIIIKSSGGSISVQSDTSEASNAITVATNIQGADDSQNGPVNFDLQSNTLIVDSSVGSQVTDVNVIVPSNADVLVTDNSGLVSVQNIRGQVNVQTNGAIETSNVSGQENLSSQSGSIKVEQANLSGQSSFTSNNGDISFSGSLDSKGSYDFETGSGSVNITLPSNASFHAEGSGTLGSSFHNDFQHDTTGPAPQPPLTVKSQSGIVTITKGP
jgi:DUF4097 and DUF4098 domain-containing protein YvlB